ncbi:MAG: hypothetical protein NTV57_16600 [Cyanobacteria bacterium]|nr:hypothetical protein [Cyanobacteriota bacterium]
MSQPGHPTSQSQGRRIALLLAGTLACFLAYGLTSHLPLIASTLISSLAVAGGASCSGRLQQRAEVLVAALGGVGGAVVGTAVVLSHKAIDTAPQGDLGQRATVVAMLALAGVIGGLVLGIDAARADRRHPRDVLRSISGLTTGVFAVLVTLVFVHSGLDQARTFSSRLSTSLTILVACVVVPGWLASRFIPSRCPTPRFPSDRLS